MCSTISGITWRILLVSFLPGLGKTTLWRIVSQRDFVRAESLGDLVEIFPELSGLQPGSSAYDLAHRKAAKQVELADKMQIKIVGFWDKNYPNIFRRSHLAPALFWFKGDVDSLGGPTVAVIGTRQPTAAGEVSAARISEAMVRRNITVVSGLALGVDVIAHKAALAANGKTIAVLAGGLDRVSPKANADIADAISRGPGGLLSEFPLESPTFSSNFVTRDSTQAALSTAVVLIQSGPLGGSMHASRAILKLRRKLVVAAPVAIDIANQEEKIEANLLFFNNGLAYLVQHYGFPPDTEDLIRKLQGRSDYDSIANEIRSDWNYLMPSSRQSSAS